MNWDVDSVSNSVAEAIFYTSKTYRTGRFYFSGTSFGNVISCSAMDFNCIQNNFKRCTIGSIITLEGCQFKNPDNTIEFVNKRIKID